MQPATSLLKNELAAAGVDVETEQGYTALEAACADVENGKLVALMITGDAPLFVEGWHAVAVVMTRLTGQPWTMETIQKIAAQRSRVHAS